MVTHILCSVVIPTMNTRKTTGILILIHYRLPRRIQVARMTIRIHTSKGMTAILIATVVLTQRSIVNILTHPNTTVTRTLGHSLTRTTTMTIHTMRTPIRIPPPHQTQSRTWLDIHGHFQNQIDPWLKGVNLMAHHCRFKSTTPSPPP
jgi:hypothetical protein